MSADIEIRREGLSLVMVEPKTDEAKGWLESVTSGTWFGGALAVEPRYLLPLVQGAVDEGFEVRRQS